MYSKFWIAWAAAGIATEVVALVARNSPRGTLSSNVRWAVLRGPAYRRVSLALWVGFSVWFANHIWG